MKNGVLFSTTNSGPVVDTSYQYINWSKEESFIENEFYIPYLGMLLKDLAFFEENSKYIINDILINFEKL